MADFAVAAAKVLPHEGGYVNDPDDPGGETKYGISKRSYPHLDIKNLTLDDAREIYASEHWAQIHGDQINEQLVATNLLDAAINSGTTTAVRQMQWLVGVSVDGRVGPKTLAAVNAADSQLLNLQYTLERIRYYKETVRRRPSSMKYLLGWITRALRCRS